MPGSACRSRAGARLVGSETLSQSYTKNDALPPFWLSYFELTEQDVADGNVYLYDFVGNGTTANHARYILFTPPTTGKTAIHAVCVGQKYHVNDSLTAWCNADSGTTINVYKL